MAQVSVVGSVGRLKGYSGAWDYLPVLESGDLFVFQCPRLSESWSPAVLIGLLIHLIQIVVLFYYFLKFICFVRERAGMSGGRAEGVRRIQSRLL